MLADERVDGVQGDAAVDGLGGVGGPVVDGLASGRERVRVGGDGRQRGRRGRRGGRRGDAGEDAAEAGPGPWGRLRLRLRGAG